MVLNKNLFPFQLAKRLSRVWIGLSQLSGNGFLWSDGSPIRLSKINFILQLKEKYFYKY